MEVISAEGALARFKPEPLRLTFIRDGNVFGQLVESENGYLTFTGDVSESANLFFNEICEINSAYIHNLKIRIAELEKNKV